MVGALSCSKQQKELKMKNFMSFLKNKSGATAIEYGLIVALISIAIVAGATISGDQLDTLFTGVGTTLTTANQ